MSLLKEIKVKGNKKINSAAECLDIEDLEEDGFSEGDQDVVQMILAGRKRSLADVTQLLPELDKGLDKATLAKLSATLRAADLQEASKLDELITVPGVKHQYFMTAVPAWLMRDQKVEPGTYRRWRARLAVSKPTL